MSPLAQALSAALLHFVWQGGLVGVLLWLALAALKNRSPAVRYLVSCAALGVLVVVPAATAAAFLFRAVPSDVRAVPMVTNLRALVVPQPMLSIWMNPEAPSAVWIAQAQLWALPVWSVGVLLFSVRLAWGCTQAFALGRGGEPAPESVRSIVAGLAARMGVARPVRVLTGSYDIDLKWTPDQMPWGLGGDPSVAPPTPIDPNRPSIFTALQEQLGLKLDSRKGPVEVLVIDHVEQPMED